MRCGWLVLFVLVRTASAQPSGDPSSAQGGVTVGPAQPPPPPQPAPPPAPVATARGTASVYGEGTVSLGPAFPVHIEYGLDFGFGAVHAKMPIDGHASLFALPVNVFVTPWLGVGARGQLTHSSDPGLDDPATPGRSDAIETPSYNAWSLGGGPRLRFYDRDQRDGTLTHRIGWLVDLDAAYVVFANNLDSPGPLGRITVGRQVLLVNDRGSGVNTGLSISAESGFGPAKEHRAILANLWFHGEAGAPPPAVHVGPDEAHLFPSTFNIDVPLFLGTNFGSVPGTLVIGLAASYGIPVGELVEPLVRADTLDIRHHDRDSTTMLAGSAGLRLRLNQWAPLAIEILGGYEHAYSIAPHPIGSGPFIDIGTGIHSVLCTGAWDLGVRLRIGVGNDNSHLATLALILGGGRGNQLGALGRPAHSCTPTAGS